MPQYKISPAGILCFLSLILISSGSHSADLDLKIIWKTNQKTMLKSAPLVADINNDGKDEVLFAGREEWIASDNVMKKEHMSTYIINNG